MEKIRELKLKYSNLLRGVLTAFRLRQRMGQYRNKKSRAVHRNTQIFHMKATRILEDAEAAGRTAWRNPRHKGRKERECASGFLFLLATRSFRITSVFPFPFTPSAAGLETLKLQ